MDMASGLRMLTPALCTGKAANTLVILSWQPPVEKKDRDQCQ